MAEKLVTGKLGKQQFLDQESVLTKKKDDSREKIGAIISHLRM